MAEQAAKWHRLPEESVQAYAAFCQYYVLPPGERSIDAAWSKSAGKDQGKRGRNVPRHWYTWSSQHKWVERAAAHDEHLAELDRQKWAERRKQLQEADWQDGQQVRRMVMDALPEASRFIQRKEVRIKGQKGQPDQLIITESFNIVGLVNALTGANKIQRLATNEPTDNIQLTGAALDAYISAQLARLANGTETSVGDASEPDEAGADEETEPDDPDL